MQSIHWRYGVALAFAALTVTVLIAGAASPWYYDKHQETTITYFIDHRSAEAFGITVTCQYTDSTCEVSDSLRDMFGIILALGVLAIVAEFAVSVILLLFTFRSIQRMIQWRPKLRIPMLSVAAVVSVLSLACWCLLFWFPSAYCENNSNPCGDESKSFLGDDHGPHAGWGLYIAAFVLSVITLIVASTSGSPDSPILYTSLQ